LIPDGLEDLGFIDDAFVLRVAAALVSEGERDAGGVLGKLAADAALISEFLGATTRGSSATSKSSATVACAVAASHKSSKIPPCAPTSFAKSCNVRRLHLASFARDTRSLVKLKSFLATRLRRNPRPAAHTADP